MRIKILTGIILVIFFISGGISGYLIGKNSVRKNNREVKVIPTLQPTTKFTKEEIAESELFERCGKFPDIKERVYLLNTDTSTSGAKWSQNCKYVLWYQDFFPLGIGWWTDEEDKALKQTPTPTPYVAQKNEGVFLLNICSNKSEKIYTPKSDEIIGNIKWINNNQLSFSVGKTEFIYSLIDRNYVEDKTN